MKSLRLVWCSVVASALVACGDDGAGSGTSTGDDASGSSTTSVGTTQPATSTDTSTSTTAPANTTSSDGSTSTAGDDTSTGVDDTTGSASTDDPGTTGLADCRPLLVEVFVDAPDGDDMLQWVKLYNPCSFDIALDDWTVGWGGESYGDPRRKALVGTIVAGGCYIVGGPVAAIGNGNPDFDLAEDFAPGLDTAQVTGGGVALFDLPLDMVDAATIPVDAVVYGPNNENGLIDESGRAVDPPHVESPPADSGGSIVRTSAQATWEVAKQPLAATCPPF